MLSQREGCVTAFTSFSMEKIDVSKEDKCSWPPYG